jgi:hypothetical protein
LAFASIGVAMSIPGLLFGGWIIRGRHDWYDWNGNTMGDGVVDVDVRATAPPISTKLNGDSSTADDTMVCSALESDATFNNPTSVDEIEACVRDEILRRHSDTVASIPVITVYYRDSTLIDVDVHIRLVESDENDDDNTRTALESSRQISKARIYLDLDN